MCLARHTRALSGRFTPVSSFQMHNVDGVFAPRTIGSAVLPWICRFSSSIHPFEPFGLEQGHCEDMGTMLAPLFRQAGKHSQSFVRGPRV